MDLDMFYCFWRGKPILQQNYMNNFDILGSLLAHCILVDSLAVIFCCFYCIFSSPEHEVLIVSYCDQSLSVVRALSTFCFKLLLLQNG